MKKQIEIQKENVKVLVDLIKENPDLIIVPMVDGEVVNGDDYSTWLGSFGKSEIDHIWNSGERIYFYSHDFEELLQDIVDDIDPDLDDELAEKMATDKVEKYDWQKSIVVQIGLP